MSTYLVHTYKIPVDLSDSSLKTYLKDAVDITLRVSLASVVPISDLSLHFEQGSNEPDAEELILYPLTIDHPIIKRPITVGDLNHIISNFYVDLYINSRMDYNLPKVRTESLIDYGQTITDLESKRKVVTFKSKSIMALDPRLFSFVTPDGADPETLVPKARRDLDRTSFDRPGLDPKAQSFFEVYGIGPYEVDCLGTGMCTDITNRVVLEWQKLKKV